jgi:hypothetical protein
MEEQQHILIINQIKATKLVSEKLAILENSLKNSSLDYEQTKTILNSVLKLPKGNTLRILSIFATSSPHGTRLIQESRINVLRLQMNISRHLNLKNPEKGPDWDLVKQHFWVLLCYFGSMDEVAKSYSGGYNGRAKPTLNILRIIADELTKAVNEGKAPKSFQQSQSL